MVEIQWNCKNLPFEILINILQSANKCDLRNYALVCKAWLAPVQTILYSNVAIKSIPQLEIFDSTVAYKAHLGEQVRVFSLLVNGGDVRGEVEKVTKIVSRLLYKGLPNLQEFPKSSLGTYFPVLDALINSRLTMLKVLYPPRSYTQEDERSSYTSCILLMRNRVEKISIIKKNHDTIQLTSNQLYKELRQLSVLQELEIWDESNTQWIQTLEHITASCNNLKRLKFEFNGGQIADIASDAFVPSRNIDSLEGKISDCKMLAYIMPKFPLLRALKLSLWYENLTLEDYARLLTYVSKMDIIKVGRFSINSRVVDVTASIWEKASVEVGSKIVEVCYFDAIKEDCALEIVKRKPAAEATISFIYHILNFNSQHTTVINDLGKFIGEFHLNYAAEEIVYYNLPLKRDLPEQLLIQIMMYCPYVHNVRLEGWVLRKHEHSPFTFCLAELYLKGCIIIGTYLEHLSTLVYYLKRLCLERVSYHSENFQTSTGYIHEYDLNRVLKINMPQTKIDSITIIGKFNSWDVPHVKLYVVIDKTCHYYRYKDGLFLSNEKEYNEAAPSSRTELCCLDIPELYFE